MLFAMQKHLVLVTALAAAVAEAAPKPALHKGIFRPPWHGKRQAAPEAGCNVLTEAATVPAPKVNIWKGMTNDEVVGLLGWLHDDSKSGLNLTIHEEAGAWDNTVGVTELLMPNKTDALAYLVGDGPLPVRYARVGVFFGAAEEAYMENFMVGPIPVSAETTIEPLHFIYNKPSGRMPNHEADSDATQAFQYQFTSAIADITQDLIGVVATGGDNDTGYFWGTDPLIKEDGKIIEWISFWSSPTEGFDSGTLLPAGMWMKFDITGRNPDNWACLGVLYNDIFYESIEELRAAWEKPDFVKLAKAQDGVWAGTSRHGDGPELEYETLPPPMMVEPSKRYSVDKDNHYASWMDFSFYLGFDRDNGLKFYNLEYMGERIIYELGIQEAHAHYAGNDPTQSTTGYLDSWYGFGASAFPLVPGWDCPASATYLDTVVHDTAQTTTSPGSICMFEQDAGYPLARHTSGDYVTVSKNTQFVVRWVATVGNYDYFMDYVFSLDGTIEVKIRASGYIQSAHYANNGDYGYQIHDALSGSMHDHVINYKVDFDINGTANSFEKVDIVPVTTTYPWLKEPRNTFKIERSFLESEDEGKLMWPENSAGMYVIVNKESKNQYGEYRGWRIMPNLGAPTHLTAVDSSIMGLGAEFAKHNLYVTRQKDTEPRAASAWNNRDLDDPLVNFGKFFDGESLDQEDLVVWFNLGTHHVPHTGDLPNTVFTTAQAGIAISPHNFLMGDPSRRMSHVMHINKTAEVPVPDIYGGQISTCAVDMAALNPDLSQYPIVDSATKWPQVYTGGAVDEEETKIINGTQASGSG